MVQDCEHALGALAGRLAVDLQETRVSRHRKARAVPETAMPKANKRNSAAAAAAAAAGSLIVQRAVKMQLLIPVVCSLTACAGQVCEGSGSSR